jgi:hypothetical protein
MAVPLILFRLVLSGAALSVHPPSIRALIGVEIGLGGGHKSAGKATDFVTFLHSPSYSACFVGHRSGAVLS